MSIINSHMNNGIFNKSGLFAIRKTEYTSVIANFNRMVSDDAGETVTAIKITDFRFNTQ